MTDQIPQTPVQPVKRSLRDRVSVVWIIPLVALAIALGIAWHSLQNRGALIEIAFTDASGIVAEQTQLRYREVSVGVVEEVTFTDDLSAVIAHVRVDKDVEDYVDEGAVFWVVEPEVSARGISGLSTVLSGVYIEGSWDGTPGGLHRHFTGLEQRPVARPDQAGRRIVLSTNTGKGLAEGTPILYKGLEVGRVGRPELSPDGVTITAEAFIEAPHDQLLTSRSRFWDASGFSFNLGAGGASVDVESLSALISGGITFETVVSGGGVVDDGTVFAVFSNQDEARTSLFDGGGTDGGNVEIAMVFEENVNGLAVGAPVTLNGLAIGEVVGLTGKVDPEQFGDDRVRLVVVLSIELDQLQLGENSTDEGAILDFFTTAVAEGWRARLTKASLLTGGLKIEMVQLPDAEPATFLRDAQPYPIFPSVTADLKGVASSAEGLLNRVSELPFEDLLQSAITFMENAAALVASDDIQTLPAEIRGVVTDVREVIGSEEIRALPERLTGIADDMISLLDDLKDRDGVAKLVEAVDNASAAAAGVAEAVGEVPALIARIEGVAAKAEALDLEALLAQATGLVENAQSILGTEAAKALPERLTEALGGVDLAVQEASAMLAEFNAAGAAEKLTTAIDAAGRAADGVSTAAEGLPELMARIEGVAAKAEALDLEALLAQATGLVENAQSILGTEAARALPERLTEALGGVDLAVQEASAMLAEFNAAGAAEKLTTAIDAAGRAADGVSTAVEGVPELMARIEGVAAKAEALDLEALLAQATGLVESAEGILGTDAARVLPERLVDALEGVDLAVQEASALMAEFNAAGAVEKLTDAIGSAGRAADSVSTAVEGVPELVTQIQAVAAKAEAMELDALVNEVTALVESADALIGTEAARELPASLNAALDEMSTALAELRAGGTVENVNATLASARAAASSVAQVTDELPAMVRQTEKVLREAELALAGLSDSGALNRDAREALRQVARAADSVRSLARTLERKPNALLTGK